MNAWVVATGLFVVILGFEFVMFRYVGFGYAPGSRTENAAPSGSASRSDRTGDADGADRPSNSPVGSDEGLPPREGADDATPCAVCGVPNEDVPTIHYCRNCLARVR